MLRASPVYRPPVSTIALALAAAATSRLASVFTRCLHRSPPLHCHVHRVFLPSSHVASFQLHYAAALHHQRNLDSSAFFDCFRRVASTRLLTRRRSFHILFFFLFILHTFFRCFSCTLAPVTCRLIATCAKETITLRDCLISLLLSTYASHVKTYKTRLFNQPVAFRNFQIV